MDDPATASCDVTLQTASGSVTGASAPHEGAHNERGSRLSPLAVDPQTRVKAIVNPVSGKKGGIVTNATGPLEVGKALEAAGIQADIFETRAAEDGTLLALQALD